MVCGGSTFLTSMQFDVLLVQPLLFQQMWFLNLINLCFATHRTRNPKRRDFQVVDVVLLPFFFEKEYDRGSPYSDFVFK
jgi:hypothetical protein